ncbi:MAG TPA: SprT family zinc-dependent metalloprotease [Beijerinckiaceae bacterium]|nr:SprT family zinc-dependent metalloprotease [Beijerinckiaceae bacterium]
MFTWPPRLLRPAVPAPPKEERFEVAHEGSVYAVSVRRSAAARRLILRVRNDTGDVVLTVPKRLSLSCAKDFATRQGGWIAARVARLPDRQPFVPGAVIPLRGVLHRLALRDGLRGAARIEPAGADGTPGLSIACDPAHFSRRVLDFLRAEAKRDLTAASRRYAERLQVSIARISIKDTRSRWGSCSSAGALSYSWRMIMAPPHVLDYLAAHELAHRIELNHSQRFWKTVAAICPHWREAENWLTRHGSGLHRYGPAGGRPTGL